MNQASDLQEAKSSNNLGFLIDLALYISVMFLIREVYFEQFDFIVNGLFWSITTLVLATWRMKARGYGWKDLGLMKPKNLWKTLGITAVIMIAIVGSIMVFEILKDQIPMNLKPDTSSENAVAKFGLEKGGWTHFLLIIPFVWLQSMLEEMLDRGFMINWIEKVFSSTTFATILAVLLQAFIFGFRHSYDLSERSITVGIIGLVMGTVYVLSGRNLWPLIIAHCILNTLSFVEKVM
jgi:hypothetical protein